MSGNGFDPASFGAGFGGGQAKGRAEADAAVGRANNRANEAENSKQSAVAGAQNTSLALAMKVGQLNNEIDNRWIPYAVKLNASIFANRVAKADLIEALKKLDPANADQIVKDANQHRLDEYATLKGEKLKPIIDETYKESEDERRDR